MIFGGPVIDIACIPSDPLTLWSAGYQGGPVVYVDDRLVLRLYSFQAY